MSTASQVDEVAKLDSILLIDWIEALWRRKFLGLAILLVFVGAAVAYLHIAAYRYTAVLTVTPADQNAPKASSGLAGIGALAGIDLNTPTGSAFAVYAEAATSYPVAEELSRDRALMRAIFKRSWDASQRRWREPESAFRSLSTAIKGLLGVPVKPWQPPGARELQAYIVENVLVVEDKKKAFVSVSYQNEDPQLAKRLLRQINTAADDFLRRRSLARASIYVNYLERRLAQIQVADYRLSILQALGTYERTRMMASVDASFAAESFGDIWVSPNFTSPNPWLVLLLAATLAIVTWLALAIVVLPLISLAARAVAAKSVADHP